MSDETTQQKREYAKALLKTPDDPYAAALSVFGEGDLGYALQISREWPTDPDVKALQATLVEDQGEKSFLPSQTDLARALWNKASRCSDTEIALKAYKLYADVMGFIEKPGTTVTNNTLVDNRRVMVVTDHGSDAEWEEKLLKQQAALTLDARQTAIN